MTPFENRKDVVLVVDDSPESLSMINDTLVAAGLTVLVALEGEQAINIANNITPDIILLDALMPQLDGFETCKRLKANRELSHIPIIFMTGLSDTESIVKGFEVGGIDYIQKPVNTEELVARMKAHLSNSRLTLKARAALDSTGQYLFACDEEGKILWSTPQAHHFFSEMDNASPSHMADLTSQLKALVNTPISDNNTVVHYHDLNIRYLGQTDSREHLLRLVRSNQTDESTRLMQAFSLTKRETEVLTWIARGKANSEIAVILDISPRTINKHLEQIFKKLNVENRTSAAVMALQIIE